MNLLPRCPLPAPAHSLHIISEIINKRRQLLNLFPVRYVVYSVDKGLLHPVKMLRNRLIGGQHKVLNDIRGHIPLIRPYVNVMPFSVQRYLALRKIKVNGTPFATLFPQDGRQLFHVPKHGQQPAVLPVFFLIYSCLILQERLYRRVRHTLIDPDY